jgi:hypothetical protein
MNTTSTPHPADSSQRKVWGIVWPTERTVRVVPLPGECGFCWPEIDRHQARPRSAFAWLRRDKGGVGSSARSGIRASHLWTNLNLTFVPFGVLAS